MTASGAVRYDRGSPTIALINDSQDVPQKRVEAICKALQKQIDRDFFPLWGWRATLHPSTRRPPGKAMQIWLKQAPDDDALGYHFIDGLPISYVFTRDEHGEPVSDYDATLSHEVLEMIADPGVNLYASGYYIKGKRHYKCWVPYEVCDPVEENLYSIDGVRVSDFVVPEWFEGERPAGSLRFSFRGSVSEPFALARGGYSDVVVGNRLRTVWGARANRRRRRHRHLARARVGGHLLAPQS